MSDLAREARDLLREATTATLAFADGEGPWAAAVYFAADGFRLLWLSKPDARHSRAIAAGRRVAAEVHVEATDWREIRGLQMAGRAAEVVRPEERRRARSLYLERFPFARPLLARLRGVRWYAFVPDRIASVDNARGLGGRREIDLPGGSA